MRRDRIVAKGPLCVSRRWKPQFHPQSPASLRSSQTNATYVPDPVDIFSRCDTWRRIHNDNVEAQGLLPAPATLKSNVLSIFAAAARICGKQRHCSSYGLYPNDTNARSGGCKADCYCDRATRILSSLPRRRLCRYRSITEGFAITLSNGDPSALTVPASLTIPADMDKATFAMATRPISGDRQVTIAASAPATSAMARLEIWTLLTGPTSALRYASEPGDVVGDGQVKRIDASPNALFSGDVGLDHHGLSLEVRSPDYRSWWMLIMTAPPGQALIPGVYPNAKRVPAIGSSDPWLQFYGAGRGCNLSTGQFEIFEAVYGRQTIGNQTGGTIERFRARFKQYCDGSPAALDGEVFLASVQLRCKVLNSC